MEKARKVFKKMYNLIMKPEMQILPGQLAFFLVLSIIPMIALLGVIATKLSIPVDLISITVSDALPSKMSNILMGMFSGEGMNFNIAVFFFAAFLLASNGTHSMIVTSDHIYKLKQASYISRRIKAFFMIILLELVIVFLILVPIYGDTIFDIWKSTASNKDTVDFFYNIFLILKYPVMILVLYINIKLIYIIAPDEKIPRKSTTKGALFTTVGWILATEIYAFYVGVFTKYDIFYGSVSNIIILLLWFYILSYIFVLGLGINASGYREDVTEVINFKKIKTKNSK